VLQFMGCVEQRAVEIISEYLRTTALSSYMQNKQGASSKKALVVRHLSPTPGPKVPMTWNIEPVLDIEKVNEEEVLDIVPDEADNRPIDLRAFKVRIRRLHRAGPGLARGLRRAWHIVQRHSPFSAPPVPSRPVSLSRATCSGST